MKTVSLKNLNALKVLDETSGHTFYGFDQEWYASKWQRLSGCGPTTVASILCYFSRTRRCADACPPMARKDCVTLMEKTWKYVTPTIRGIPSTELLCKNVDSLLRAESLDFRFERLDIPRERASRPEFGRLVDFLEEPLACDSPVAFLNLNNGEEKQLDSWHWVTVVSLEYEECGNAASLKILDEGVIKQIGLTQWFQTTTLGGGFVRFLPSRNI